MPKDCHYRQICRRQQDIPSSYKSHRWIRFTARFIQYQQLG